MTHPMFEKYRTAAQKTLDENRWRFRADTIAAKCSAAGLCDAHREALLTFATFAQSREEVTRALWLHYYIQFCTQECYLDRMWTQPDGEGLSDLPIPAECEEKFPGYFRALLYLAAADHLSEYLHKRNLPGRYLTQYYEKYIEMAEHNRVSHDTFGLCRLASFLYAYAYPFIAQIGRLAYQVRRFPDFVQVYENERGDHRIAALPARAYDEQGFPAEQGGVIPDYRLTADTLCARFFDGNGRLQAHTQTLRLCEWHTRWKPGDLMASIHIPGHERLSAEAVNDSFARAKVELPRLFSSFDLQGYMCRTWFLDPVLHEVLPPTSNMLRFAARFDLVLGEDNQNHSLFDHIFNVKPTALENLVPRNDFQKKMLDRAMRGEKLYWTYGFLRKGAEAVFE